MFEPLLEPVATKTSPGFAKEIFDQDPALYYVSLELGLFLASFLLEETFTIFFSSGCHNKNLINNARRHHFENILSKALQELNLLLLKAEFITRWVILLEAHCIKTAKVSILNC